MNIEKVIQEIEAAGKATDKRGYDSADPAEHGEGHRESVEIIRKHLANDPIVMHDPGPNVKEPGLPMGIIHVDYEPRKA